MIAVAAAVGPKRAVEARFCLLLLHRRATVLRPRGR